MIRSERKMLRCAVDRCTFGLSKTSCLHQKIASGNFSQATTIVSRMQRSIISVINQKGGCAKSSTCFHTAGYFAKAGYRVLLIDADPQGSLSQAFFGSTAIEALPAEQTLAAIFDEYLFDVSVDGLKLSTPIEGIDLIPANLHLGKFNVSEPTETDLNQFMLSTLLDTDFNHNMVLIDCPPNLYQCSWNALLASDYVAVPVIADDLGVQGLRAVQEAIALAQELNPGLKLLGQFLTKFDRRVGIHREFESVLRRIYGDQIFDTVTLEASAFKLAVNAKLPVTHYSSWSRATRQTRNLALEMIDRMDRHTASRKVA